MIFELLLARHDITIDRIMLGSSFKWRLRALSDAASRGHKEIVELLLARNDIDVNAGELLGVAEDQEYINIAQLMTFMLMQMHH